MNHYIYIITNLINGKKYIGKRSCSCPIDQDPYMGSGVALKNAQKKYGIENFTKHILLVCETEEQAYEEEKKAIALVKAWKNPQYYNIDGGGRGTGSGESHPKTGKKYTFSEEHKQKLSIVKKGKYIRANNHNARKVVCLNNREIFECITDASEKYGIKISHITECCQGDIFSAGVDFNKQKIVWCYYEDYIKLSNQQIIEKIKNANTRNKGANNYLARAIICINTLEVFETSVEAGNKYNIGQSHISAVCRGKRKSAGKHPETGEKLVWQYLEDYEKNKKDAI